MIHNIPFSFRESISTHIFHVNEFLEISCIVLHNMTHHSFNMFLCLFESLHGSKSSFEIIFIEIELEHSAS